MSCLLIFSYFSRFRFINSCPAWKNLPDCIKHNATGIVRFLMKSRADSTVTRFKFICWCKIHNIGVKLPFSVSVVSVFMSKAYEDSKSYASLVLVHAALKWLHSFIPDDVQSPLDVSICHSFLEGAKCVKTRSIVKSDVCKYRP